METLIPHISRYFKIKLIVFLILLCGIIARAYGFEFDLMPLDINFYGAVVAGKNIIAYGDNGAYMMTTDRGRSWKQYSLNEFGIIREMINYNDTIWGIMDEGYLLASYDYGFSWRLERYEIDSDEHFITLVGSDYYIFVRSTKGIYRFDKDFNLINKLKDTIIEIDYRRVITWQPLNYVESYFLARTKLFYSAGKLIVNSDPYWYGILIIRENLSKIDTLDFKTKIYIKSGNYYVYGIFNYKDKILFNVSGNLYLTDKDLNEWKYFFPDTTFMNVNDSTYLCKYPIEEYNLGRTFFVKNDKLYLSVKTYPNHRFDFGGSVFQKYTYWYDDYKIKIYDKDENNKPILRDLNNRFDNRYYTPMVIYGEPYSSTAFAFVNEGVVLEDSIFIKIGPNKTIIQSRDYCRSWELISSFNAAPSVILNDSTYIFLNMHDYYKNVDRTFDYGTTFQPTEVGLDTMFRRRILTYQDRLCNWHRDTVESYDTLTFFALSSGTALIHFDPDGRGFWSSGGSLPIDEYWPHFAYSLNYGKQFKFSKLLNDLVFYRKINQVIKLGDVYFFSIGIPSDYLNYPAFYAFVYLDTNFNSYRLQTFGKKFGIEHIDIKYLLADNLENFIMFCIVQDSTDLTLKHFEIRETSDSGRTSNTIVRIDKNLNIVQFYEHNKDSVFFTTMNPTRLYLFDRKRRGIDTLYQNDTLDKALLMKIGNRWFLVGEGFILESKDRTLRNWEEIQWHYGKPRFEEVIFKGNVAIAKLSDSLRPVNYYRIMLKELSKVEEPKVDVRYYTTQFYATEAYPTPASNVVKSRVYWDGSFDLRESIDGIYDVMGNKIEGKERIRIEAKGEATAELIWECRGVPSGVYFIVVRHNGGSETIPVVIE